MFTRIEIENFRSCDNTTVEELGAFAVLIGRNGAGKSNILQAFKFASSNALGTNAMALMTALPFKISVDFTRGEKLNRYLIQVEQKKLDVEIAHKKVEVAGRTPFMISLKESWRQKHEGSWRELVTRSGATVSIEGREKTMRIGGITPCLPALRSLLSDTDELIPKIDDVLSFFGNVHYCPMNETIDTSREFSFATNEAEFDKWAEVFRSTGEHQDDIQKIILLMYFEHEEKFEALKHSLGANGLGVVNDISVEIHRSTSPDPQIPASTFYFLTFSQSPKTIERYIYDKLSHGTRRIIRIMAMLLLNESSVMLIEHPEDGIHPGLLQKVIGQLKSYADPTQIIFTSHSPDALNCISPDQVRLVTMETDGTKVRALSPAEIDNAKSYIRESGSLSEFIQAIQG